MPNWCDNEITFKGEPEPIAKLARLITAPVKKMSSKDAWLLTLSFDQPPWEYGEPFVSDLEPGELIMSRTLGFVNKSTFDYSEMVDVLGTKWDFDLECIDIYDTEITGRASTAWSNPVGWFIMVCKEYEVEGEMSSGEGGNDFGTVVTVEGGKVSHYGSTYNYWACLNFGSSEEYKEWLLEDQDEYPEYIEAINKEAKDWPTSWNEYKARFHESTTQI